MLLSSYYKSNSLNLSKNDRIALLNKIKNTFEQNDSFMKITNKIIRNDKTRKKRFATKYRATKTSKRPAKSATRNLTPKITKLRNAAIRIKRITKIIRRITSKKRGIPF